MAGFESLNTTRNSCPQQNIIHAKNVLGVKQEKKKLKVKVNSKHRMQETH